MRLDVFMLDGSRKFDRNFVFDVVDDEGEIRFASGRIVGNPARILNHFADFVWLRDVASHVRLGRWILDVQSGEVSLVDDWSASDLVLPWVREAIMEGYLESV